MATKLVYKLLFIVLFVSLSGCGVVNSTPGLQLSQAVSLPLTGDKASVVGASALLLESTQNGYFNLVPISAGDGKPVNGFAPVEFGTSTTFAFSPDRQQIAFVTNSTMSCPNACLHVLNLHAWKEDVTPIVLPNSLADWIRLTFDQSGERIALFIDSNAGNGGQLLLIDPAQDKIVQKVDVSSNIFQMAFTPAGDLAVYGNRAGNPNQLTTMYVTLFSTPSLEVKWQQDLKMVSYGTEPLDPSADPSQGQYLDPAAVFSSAQSRLYVVAADKPLLVTVDFTRQAVQSATIQPRQSRLVRLMALGAGVVYAKMLNGTTKNAVLSNDGKYLYVIGTTTTAVKDQSGNWNMQTTPLGLQKVDLQDGTEVAKLATTASTVGLSLDGKTILLNGWDDNSAGPAHSWTDLVDAASLKVTGRIFSELLPSRLLDGSLAWLGSSWSQNGGVDKMEIYDAGTQKIRIKLADAEMNDSVWVQIP